MDIVRVSEKHSSYKNLIPLVSSPCIVYSQRSLQFPFSENDIFTDDFSYLTVLLHSPWKKKRSSGRRRATY